MQTCKPDLRSREWNCRSATRRCRYAFWICRYAISFPAPRNAVAGLQFGIVNRSPHWSDVLPLSVPRSVCKSARDSTFAVVFGVSGFGDSSPVYFAVRRTPNTARAVAQESTTYSSWNPWILRQTAREVKFFVCRFHSFVPSDSVLLKPRHIVNLIGACISTRFR